MLISQDYFDETLLECQELFEYSNDQAVQETIAELQSSNSSNNGGGVSLEHLSLTHPESAEGQKDRTLQQAFLESLSGEAINIEAVTGMLQDAGAPKLDKNEPSSSNGTTATNRLLMLWSLMLQKDLWSSHIVPWMMATKYDSISPLLTLILALFPDAWQFHALSRTLKLQIAPTLFFVDKKVDAQVSRYNWFRLLETARVEKDKSLLLLLLQVARKLCNGCEDNKKTFVNAAISCRGEIGENGLELLIQCLPSNPLDTDNDETLTAITQDVCGLIAILGKFQPLAEPTAERSGTDKTPQTPTISSAHANVKELHKANAVPSLHRLAKQTLVAANEGHDSNSQSCSDTLCDALAALRVMAIDNDIVQNMIALGILDTIQHSLEVAVQESCSSATRSSCLPLATATFGLVRNLCANDEVKTSICKSSLSSILHVMQNYLDDKDDKATGKNRAVLHEHACGILGAMALRQPSNAQAIVEYGSTTQDSNTITGGHVLILQAMKAFPEKTTLQRQGCLALRNIASRLSEDDKAKILDAGAEDIIQNIAGRHPASSEEAYSALRDLGCNPVMWNLDEMGRATTKSTTQQFGTVQSNFRPTYD
jgi:hypothetical protein